MWFAYDLLSPPYIYSLYIMSTFCLQSYETGLIFISVRFRDTVGPVQVPQMMPSASVVFSPTMYLPFRWLCKQSLNHQAPRFVLAQFRLEESWSRSQVENLWPLRCPRGWSWDRMLSPEAKTPWADYIFLQPISFMWVLKVSIVLYLDLININPRPEKIPIEESFTCQRKSIMQCSCL